MYTGMRGSTRTILRKSGACLAAASLLWAGASLASGSLQEIQAVNATWDADLVVALEGGKKQLGLGDEVRYHLSAAEGGYCYLLHVDTQGNASVMQPSDCSNAASGSYFPASGTLKASAPEGKETVVAVISQKPLGNFDALLRDTGGYKALDKASFSLVMSDLNAGSAAHTLDLAKTSYWVGAEQVAMNDPELQYTTRGIIRKVVESTESEITSNEVSFPVQQINFEFGSDELAEDGIRQLNEFGAAMVSPELASMRLRVAGHTDDLGEAAYNQDLSERRAKSVAAYLEENFDINSNRLDVVGLGEEEPLVTETSRSAREQNRRVEMVFLVE